MSNPASTDTEETEATTIHLPASLKARLRVAAAMEGKGMGPYVVDLLDKQLPTLPDATSTKKKSPK